MKASGELELARAAAKGDPGAFDRLCKLYPPRLHRFITLMGVDEPDDVLQEVLLEAFASLSGFRGDSRLSSWMIGIALNRCRRWWRSRGKAAASADPAALDGHDPRARERSIVSTLVRRESAERIALALDRLAPLFREAFVLKHVEGLDFKEIGILTGTTEGTARVRAHRAKLLLQQDLGPAFQTLMEGLTR
jgi:RNA polymerase sigma-70 factor (ECF subfamily)